MAVSSTVWRTVAIVTCLATAIILLLVTGNFITGIITVEEVKREGHGIKTMGKMAGGQAELLEEQLSDLQESADRQAQQSANLNQQLSSLQQSANVQAHQNSLLLNKLDQLQQSSTAVNSEKAWDPIPIDFSNVPAAGNANAFVQETRKVDIADPDTPWPLNMRSSGDVSCVAVSSVNGSRYFVAWLGPGFGINGVHTSSSSNNFEQVFLPGAPVFLSPSQRMENGFTDDPYACAIGPRLYNGVFTFNCGGNYCDRFYLGVRHFNQLSVFGNSDTVMYHSDDGGATWSGPRTLASIPGNAISPSRSGFDNVDMDVNVNPQHSEFGTVYLAIGADLNTLTYINLYMSRDGGLEFNVAKVLNMGPSDFIVDDDDPSTSSSTNWWPSLKLAGDGGVIVIAKTGTENTGFTAVWRVSADGKHVELDKTRFAMDQEGSMTVVPNPFGGSGFLLLPGYMQDGHVPRKCFCLFAPTLAVSGNDVYIMWRAYYDQNTDTPLTRQFMTRSTDGGRSYSAPIEVINTVLNYPGYFPVCAFIEAWDNIVVTVSHFIETADARFQLPQGGATGQGIGLLVSKDKGATFNQVTFVSQSPIWASAVSSGFAEATIGTFKLGIVRIPGTNCVRISSWKPRDGIKECVPSTFPTSLYDLIAGDASTFIAGFSVSQCGNNTFTNTPVPFPFFTGGHRCYIQEECDVYGVAGIGGARWGDLETYTNVLCVA